MTEQSEVLSAGDARARVAVLEAENAALRKRICVPDGWRASLPTGSVLRPGDYWELYGPNGGGVVNDDEVSSWVVRELLDTLAASPAPVERCPNCDDTGDVHRADGEWLGECTCSAAPVEPVKQTANVFWVLFDGTTDVKYIKKDSDAGTLAFFDNEEDAAWAKRFNPGTDYKRVEYYTTPQPATTAAQDVAGLHLLERIEKHLTNWLELDICECEFGHNCGYNDVIRDRDALRGLIAAHQSGGAK